LQKKKKGALTEKKARRGGGEDIFHQITKENLKEKENKPFGGAREKKNKSDSGILGTATPQQIPNPRIQKSGGGNRRGNEESEKIYSKELESHKRAA